MIVYEITAIVEAGSVEKFERFMREKHIPDLLATGFFEGAEMALTTEDRYRIRYLTRDQTMLDKYFETKAEHLRKDFIRNFPDGVHVSREILRVLQIWPQEPI